MLRLDTQLCDDTEDQSSDSIASGGMTPRVEKPPSNILGEQSVKPKKERPKSPMPYHGGRTARNSLPVHAKAGLLPPITSSPGMLILDLIKI